MVAEILSQEMETTTEEFAPEQADFSNAASVTTRAEKNLALRGGVELILRNARFLPTGDRKLLRDFYLRGVKLETFAQKFGVTITQVRRRIRAIRRRMVDPGFLLTVQFSSRLPEPLSNLARLHFRNGVSIVGCAKQMNLTEHKTRQALRLARAMLLMAGVNRYGGKDARKRIVIAALLSPSAPRIYSPRPRKIAASA